MANVSVAIHLLASIPTWLSLITAIEQPFIELVRICSCRESNRTGATQGSPPIPPRLPPPLRGETEGEQAIRGEMERGEASRTDIPCHDPLELVEAELGQYRLITPASISHDELPRFHGGAVGYLSYEAAARFEHLPVPEKNDAWIAPGRFLLH